MKKVISYLLIVSVFLTLIACGTDNSKLADTAAENSDYYWKCDMKSQYPLGKDVEIRGLAALNNCLFICGISENASKIVRVPYTVDDHSIHFQDASDLDLDYILQDTEIINMSSNSNGIYVLAKQLLSDENLYLVLILDDTGECIQHFSVEYLDTETPDSIVADENNSFYLRGIHNIYKYSDTGQVLGHIENESLDIYPPLILGNKLIAQCLSFEKNQPILSIADFERESFDNIEHSEEIGLTFSICSSINKNALINDGTHLIKLNAELKPEVLFDWYELTGEYGNKYKYILQLNNHDFIVVPRQFDGFDYSGQAGGEIIKLSAEYCEDTRECVTIGIYGQGSMMLDRLNYMLNHCNPNFRADCINYGNDESGLSKLVADIAHEDSLDIVISEGWQLDRRGSFTDLYQFIDNDSKLKRESFIPEMLDYLETDGELKQIWGSFGISTIVKYNELAAAPEKLKLSQCQSYLDSVEFEGVLLDSFITKETLLNYLSNSILNDAFNEETETFKLNTDYAMELLELCNRQPEEFLTENGSYPANPEASTVLKDLEIQLDNLDYMQENEIPHEFFDGKDGTDNFTSVYSNYSSCYMIPESCKNKELAWNFLKTLLSYDYQLESFAKNHLGFPTNSEALKAALKMSKSEETREEIESLINQASFTGYDETELKEILINGMQPYFYGQSSLEEAIDKTTGKLNIWYAEHK